jgi:hypothetical protein
MDDSKTVDAGAGWSPAMDPARTEVVEVTVMHSKPDSIRNFIAAKLTETQALSFRSLAIYWRSVASKHFSALSKKMFARRAQLGTLSPCLDLQSAKSKSTTRPNLALRLRSRNARRGMSSVTVGGICTAA